MAEYYAQRACTKPTRRASSSRTRNGPTTCSARPCSADSAGLRRSPTSRYFSHPMKARSLPAPISRSMAEWPRGDSQGGQVSLAAPKIALVTGGSRGLGRSTALALARGGADVIVTYRTQKRSGLEVVHEIEAQDRKGGGIGRALGTVA